MSIEVVRWIPRVLGLGIAGFCYLFMLEGFSPDFHWQDSLSHFAQGTLMLLLAGIAWKWGILGGCLYLGLALVSWRSWRFHGTIIAVLVTTGLLFILADAAVLMMQKH